MKEAAGVVERQHSHGWGESVVAVLARDLQRDFPDIRGVSARKLWYVPVSSPITRSPRFCSSLLQNRPSGEEFPRGNLSQSNLLETGKQAGLASVNGPEAGKLRLKRCGLVPGCEISQIGEQPDRLIVVLR